MEYQELVDLACVQGGEDYEPKMPRAFAWRSDTGAVLLVKWDRSDAHNPEREVIRDASDILVLDEDIKIFNDTVARRF